MRAFPVVLTRSTRNRLLLVLATAAALSSAPAAFAAAPEITVPGAQSTNEDTAKTFSTGGSNAISIADADPGSLTVGLSVTNGTLTLATTAGLTFSDGANGTSSMTFEGTPSDVDAALDGLSYSPTGNFNGPSTLTVDVDDGADVDSDSVAITVTAVNDNPVNTVPGTQTAIEDTPKTLSAAGGNAISVADVDAANLRVTLTSAPGTSQTLTPSSITLGSTTGLTFTAGDGVADPVSTFSGTKADVNAALDTLSFTPAGDAAGTGAATLTVFTTDLGSTGSGGTKNDTDVISFDVTGIDDGPRNAIAAGVGTYKGLDKTLSGTQAIAILDIDDADPALEVSLSATNATLTLSQTAGLTFLEGGDGTAAMKFEGTKSAVNGALLGMTVDFAPTFSGQATITVTSTEPGLTGPPGGPYTDTDVMTIEVGTPEPSIYWLSSKDTLGGRGAALARADLDGGGGWNLFDVQGGATLDIPVGSAIDVVGGRIYFSGSPTSGSPSIFSVKLDGTDLQTFVTPARAPQGLAIDAVNRRIYWAELGKITPPVASGGIFYASLDGAPVVSPVSTTGAMVTATPRAIALDLDDQRVYWTNFSSQGPSGSTTPSVAFAPLPGASGTAGTFTVPVSQPQGVAIDQATDRMFWANGSGGNATDRLKVATLDGTLSPPNGVFSISPLAGGGLRTPAIDSTADRIYWANSAANRIEYAGLASGGGGAALATGSAIVNSPDGVSILKAPEPTGAPAISGTAELGSSLTCGDAGWAPDQPNQALYRMPASTAVTWTLDGASIPGATGATHAVTAAGAYRCTRSATNFAGTSTQQSAAVSVPVPPPPPTTDPPVSDPPVSDPLLSPPAAVAKLAVAATRVPVSSSGVAAIPVDCTGALCSGAITVATTQALRLGTRTIAAGAVLGSTPLVVAAGARGTASITLNATGRSLASSRSSIPAAAVSTLAGAAATTSALTLTPARAPAVTPATTSAKASTGAVSLRVRCGATSSSSCRGTLTLTAKLDGRTTTIGKRTLSLRGGRTTAVSVTLSSAARKALARGALSAKQTAASTLTVGLASSRSASLKLTG
jgi:hypothetical protein